MKYILAIEAATIATGIAVASRLPPARPSHLREIVWTLPPQLAWLPNLIWMIWYGFFLLAVLSEAVLFCREIILARREHRPIRPMSEWLD